MFYSNTLFIAPNNTETIINNETSNMEIDNNEIVPSDSDDAY